MTKRASVTVTRGRISSLETLSKVLSYPRKLGEGGSLLPRVFPQGKKTEHVFQDEREVDCHVDGRGERSVWCVVMVPVNPGGMCRVCRVGEGCTSVFVMCVCVCLCVRVSVCVCLCGACVRRQTASPGVPTHDHRGSRTPFQLPAGSEARVLVCWVKTWPLFRFPGGSRRV